MTTSWKRFEQYAGGTWDTVVEAGLGNPTDAESNAICRLHYWGEEITPKTVAGLSAGTDFKDLTAGKPFAFRIYAPDGTHTKRFKTLEGLAKHVKKYGPPVYLRGPHAWSDDDGYRYEVQGATLVDIFGPVESA